MGELINYNKWYNELQVPLGHVDISLLAHDVGEFATDTLDAGQGKHDLLLSIDVSVDKTKNVFEISIRNQRLQ
jgi:hypothetical protein